MRRSIVVLSTALAACTAPAATIDSPQSTPAGINGNEVRTEVAPPALIEFPYHSADLVWQALPGAFAELKIPAAVMDARGRVYGNARVVVSTVGGEPIRTLFRCATDGSIGSGATSLRIQFGITASPRSAGPTKTELVVHTVAHGSSMDASRSGNVGCTSTGIMETRLKRAVEAQLAKM